ncbi:hypothetical protein N7535_006084 [Penicillium sp. DV-2018c]|nr:hypothetical protein N7535_006084 [Penicillium sp. DV-2018c]
MSPPKLDDKTVTRTESTTLQPVRRSARIFKTPVRSSSSKSSRSSRSRAGPYDRPSNSPRPEISRPHTPRRTLSLLEVLPVEIIEKIFLHSRNLNFPKASLFLARALSAEHIYRALILLAFWDNGGDVPRSEYVDRLMAPVEDVCLSFDQRRELQRAIFKCRWCTLDRICEQIPTIHLLVIHHRWTLAGIVTAENSRTDFERLLAGEDSGDIDFFTGDGPPRRKRAEGIIAQTERQLSTGYFLNISPMVMTKVESACIWETVWPVLSLTEFPPHLLRGRSNGFTAEDVAMLEMLRITSYSWFDGDCWQDMPWRELPDDVIHVDRKALNQGIQNAILHPNLDNYRAMVSLLKLDEYTFRCKPEHRHINIIYKIPAEHFLAVTRTGRENPDHNLKFFAALVRASAESLPTDSPEITQWIVDNIELGEQDPSAYGETNAKFASWLSNFLLRLPAHRYEATNFPYYQLFHYGQLNTSDHEGRHFINEYLETSKEFMSYTSNWLEETSFLVEDHWLKKEWRRKVQERLKKG